MNLGRILLRQSGLPLRLTYGCRLHRVRCLLLWEREIMGEGRRWNRFGFHCSSVVDGLSHEPHHGSTKTVVQSARPRSEEHTSELQSLMRISYAVFCLKKTKNQKTIKHTSKQHSYHKTYYHQPITST